MKNNKDSHKTSSLNDCRLITLNKHHHENGNLTVVESNKELPFDIKRIYYIYDVPGGAERGGHSHIECASFLIAVSIADCCSNVFPSNILKCISSSICNSIQSFNEHGTNIFPKF